MPRTKPTLADLQHLRASCDSQPRLWRIFNRLIREYTDDNPLVYFRICRQLGLTPLIIEQQIAEYWASEARAILHELDRGDYERVAELDAILDRGAKGLGVSSDQLDCIHAQAEGRRWDIPRTLAA